jgi:enoyl-CoA hydratase/carnithine racemase
MGVDIRIADYVAVVVLNRPQALNAIDGPMRLEVQAAWRRIAEDADIHVAVVTGAGERAFSAGADLKHNPPPAASFAQERYGDGLEGSLTLGMEAIDKPLICAFNGLALGGGLEIGLGCDIRIAADNASFALPEVRVGTLPGSGGTQRLPRLIGGSDAMWMLLTGDTIDAAEALRIGLVSRVVSPARLEESALALARRIAGHAPLAVRAVKRLVRQGMDLPLAHALDAERAAWGLLRDTEDRREGRAAFAEKRKPVYRGR